MRDFRGGIKFWVTAIGVVIIAALAADAVNERLDNLELPNPTNLFLMRRSLEFFGHLDSILTDPNMQVALFGASEVEGFMDPARLTAILHHAGRTEEALNLGMRAMHPTFFKAFAEEFSRRCQAHGRRLSFAFVQLPRVRLTRKYRAYMPPTAVRELTESLDAGSWPFNARIPAISSWFSTRRTLFRFEDDRVFKAYFDIYTDRSFMEFPSWSMAKGGYFSFNRDRDPGHVESAFRLRGEPWAVSWQLRYFERCCGLLSAEFDPDSVEETIEGVKALKKVFDHVILYNLPDRILSSDQPQPKAEVDELFRTVAEKSGAEIADVAGELDVRGRADFYDIHHPTPQGADKIFSGMLREIEQHGGRK